MSRLSAHTSWLLFFIGILLVGCVTGKPKPQQQLSASDALPVFIKGSQSLYDTFGLPIDGFEGVKICLRPLDTVNIDLVYGLLSIVLDSERTIKVEYDGEDMSLSGSLALPPFKEIAYGKTISPMTGLVTELRPSYLYFPIRDGKWMYSIDNKMTTIAYDVTLIEVDQTDHCP
jgi:hypothetical protein